jgi:hypothetical protein
MVRVMVGVGEVWEMWWLFRLGCLFDNVCAVGYLSHKSETELLWLSFRLSVSNRSGGW